MKHINLPILVLILALYALSTHTMAADRDPYSYFYEGETISLSASKDLIAISSPRTTLDQQLLSEGLARDALSEQDALKQHNVTLYRFSKPPGPKSRQDRLLRRMAADAAEQGSVFQPTFEQGGAILIPKDEVIVGFTSEIDLQAAKELLEPYTKGLLILETRAHRRNTYVLRIGDPGQGRAFAVARALAEVEEVRFAEPNLIVVPLGPPAAPGRPDLFKLLKKKRPAPAQSGKKAKTNSMQRQVHASVSWTVLIDQDFEGSGLPAGWTTGKWSDTAPDVFWNTTTNRSHSGSGSIHASSGGPDGIPPPGAYPNEVANWLDTPPLDLDGFEEVYFELWIFGKFADVNDAGLAYVHNPAVPDSLVVLGPGLLWVGYTPDLTTDPTTKNGWRRVLYRVPPSARQDNMQIGLAFVSNDTGGGEGLYVDKIRVVATADVDTDPIGNDAYGARLYEFENAGQIAGLGGYDNDLHIPEAWSQVQVAPDVVVAAVDSGVDLSHPDLNLVTGYDPDGSVGGSPRGPHGTAVAGNIGARHNNAVGVMGTAPGIKIMPVYLGSTFAEAAQALDVAVAKGAHVLSNSWGWVGAPSLDIASAVQDALGGGVAVLFAAGNGPDRAPFTYDTAFPCSLTATTAVVCVGASSPTDEHKNAASSDGSTWWGSSYIGPGPDVTAPSPWSYTTDQQGTSGYNDGSQIDAANPASASYTPSFGGTSSATPKVAGVVALMLSANSQLTPAQVKRILRATADDIDTPGPDDRTGGGRVNAGAAVERAAEVPGAPRLYFIHAAGNRKLAANSNKQPASLVVAVNSSRGPVTGLSESNFRVHAGPVGPGGCLVEITRVISNFPGRYMVDIVPITRNPSCVWRVGPYTIAVLVSNGTFSGVGVADLVIPENTACSGSLCGTAITIQGGTQDVGAGLSGITITPCPDGHQAVSGGYGFNDPNVSDPRFLIRGTRAGTTANGNSAWFTDFKNTGSQRTDFTTQVVCVKTE